MVVGGKRKGEGELRCGVNTMGEEETGAKVGGRQFHGEQLPQTDHRQGRCFHSAETKGPYLSRKKKEEGEMGKMRNASSNRLSL